MFIDSIIIGNYDFTGKALDQNFVFASLDNAEKKVLASAMEKQLIRERENIITQGENMSVKNEILNVSTATVTRCCMLQRK